MACTETFAALRIFSEEHHPDTISEILGVVASRTIPRDPKAKYRVRRETHYWVWETRDFIESADNEEHLTALIEEFRGRANALAKLREMGCQTDVSNYWVSNGQGGPILEVDMMAEFVRLGLSIWWDVYFEDQEDSDS